MQHKICKRCNVEYLASGEFFPKEARNKDGFAVWCKVCVRKRAAELRYGRTKRLYSSKPQARKSAAAKYGSAKNYYCSVLSCTKYAEELHHVDYSAYLDVVPLCSIHHQKWHTLQEWEERFKNDDFDNKIPTELLSEPDLAKRS